MKKNKTKKALATLAIAGMTLSMTPFNAFADGVTTARLFGADRIGTAVAVANSGWTTATTVILAPAADANLVDALAAAPLAGKTAPILLTDNNTLTDATKAELIKLGATKVYVVGAISQTVVDQINAMTGVTATALKGADRTATATMISAKLTAPAGSFVVGYGALADALSVASYAAANNYSILVANPDGTLPASEAAFKGATTYIIGGPTLVADIAGATRLFGADRFATNQAVLNALTYKYDKVYLANGTDAHLVDSLVASSLAAQTQAPIVLADTNNVASAASVHAKLAANAVVTALGGTTVVPDTAVTQITSGISSTPPITNPVTISALSVTGQLVGTGALSAPAVAAVNTGITVAGTVNGASAANASITYLVSTSSNITAKDMNGNTLASTNLNSPVIVGNDTFNASYSVPADASGNVKAVFTSTASSAQAFNVVVEAPFSNNGQPVMSNEASMEWGVPGTTVLSPLYTSSNPDSLNFSTSGSMRGLVPVVATILPVVGSTTPVSGQSVKFTMTAGANPTGSANAFFTDATGTSSVASGAVVGKGGSATSVNYVVTTDANGQALVYINSNLPTNSGVADLGAIMNVSVQAQLVNGGGSTNAGYYQWKAVSQPAKIGNVSPSAMLNPTGISLTSNVVLNSAETATSGSQMTISGTIQDSAGNPVKNAQVAIQDYDIFGTDGSNNVQNDAYVLNGTTTLFSAVNYPIVTSDSNGNFSVVVTANVPVTSSVLSSVTKYFAYYVPPTVAITTGQSLPTIIGTAVTPLSFVGNSNSGNFLDLVWQQGQTVQAAAISASPLLSTYSGISAIPTSSASYSDILGADRELYAGAFNQNGVMVAPTSSTSAGNQYAGYGLDFNITLPSNVTIEKFGTGLDTLPWKTSDNTSGDAPTQAELQYYNGQLHLVSWTGVTTGVHAVAQILNDAAAYDGSGQLIFYANSLGTNATAGAINVAVQAYSSVGATWSSTNGQGGASASITANYTTASGLTSLGVTNSISQMTTYQPLINTNSAPANTVTVSGTAFDGYDTGNNASFVVAPFNNYVSMATLPTQGLTYSMSSTLTGKIRAVDGYQVQSAPQSAQVNVQNNGMVSVNNVAIWPAFAGTAIGYANDGIYNYVLIKNGSTITLNQVVVNSGAANTFNQVGIWTEPTGTYEHGSFEGFLGFTVNGATLNLMHSTGGSGTPGINAAGTVTSITGSNTAPSSLTVGVNFAPVQAVTALVSDKYSETPIVTISNSLNSKTATVTAAFSASSGTSVGAISNVTANPMSANFAQGSSQNITFKALDGYGNPLPNQTFYIQSSTLAGTWITQVNGTAIQQSLNLGGGGNSSFQTVPTPVPLFLSSTDTTTSVNPILYSSVSVSGSLSANNLNSTSVLPYVALTTGVDGTVNITLQNGNVQYYTGTTGGAAATTVMDPGVAVAGSLLSYTAVPGSTGALNIGTVNVQVGSLASSGVKTALTMTKAGKATATTSAPTAAVDTITVTKGATVAGYASATVDSGANIPIFFNGTETIAQTATDIAAALNGNTAVTTVYTVNATSTGVTLTQRTPSATAPVATFVGSATGAVGTTSVTTAYDAGGVVTPAAFAVYNLSVYSGATTAGTLNLTFRDGAQTKTATVTVTAGESASNVASAIATALNAAGITGYTISPSGSNVVITQTGTMAPVTITLAVQG